MYIYLKYMGSGRTVAEIERNLRLADGVLKYQTVLLRSDVELGTVSVPDEDVKFERIELPPLEEERDESRERQLGLVESDRREQRGPESVPMHDDADEPDIDGAADEEEES